ncbi:MAG: F0F1 ATP synthase subunit A [Candidatus Dormibacteria bacterium]
MIGPLLAAAGPQVSQPTTVICGAKPLLVNPVPITYCDVNQDTLISSLVAIAITLVLGFLIARRLRSGRPGKLQMLLEFFLGYVKDLVRDSVGDGADFIIPIAATIGFYILVANWIAFFPLARPIQPAASDVNQTLAMAVVVIVVVQVYSVKVLGFRGYLRRFTKPFELNWAMRVVFIPLNVIEEVAKPITLALRLFGNIFAGLVMVDLLSELPVFLAWIPVTAWKLFDVLFIGAIQAFIFMLLTVIYFGLAREGLEEEGHHGAQAAAAHAQH